MPPLVQEVARNVALRAFSRFEHSWINCSRSFGGRDRHRDRDGPQGGEKNGENASERSQAFRARVRTLARRKSAVCGALTVHDVVAGEAAASGNGADELHATCTTKHEGAEMHGMRRPTATKMSPAPRGHPCIAVRWPLRHAQRGHRSIEGIEWCCHRGVDCPSPCEANLVLQPEFTSRWPRPRGAGPPVVLVASLCGCWGTGSSPPGGGRSTRPGIISTRWSGRIRRAATPRRGAPRPGCCSRPHVARAPRRCASSPPAPHEPCAVQGG